jgi:hypothetical protein
VDNSCSAGFDQPGIFVQISILLAGQRDRAKTAIDGAMPLPCGGCANGPR